ncbi:MAG TPA: hypothetical protein PK922_05350 [Syntrophorhabdus sp.]|jgi:hypothetical protein|nr:hypothetical protein [Syntrophorhabdus sp.]
MKANTAGSMKSAPPNHDICRKIIALVAMIFASAKRFSRHMYLGDKDILTQEFSLKRSPATVATLIWMSNNLKTIMVAEAGLFL